MVPTSDPKSPALYKCQIYSQNGGYPTAVPPQGTDQGSPNRLRRAKSLDEELQEQGGSSSASKVEQDDRRENIRPKKKADLYPPRDMKAGEGDYYRPNPDGKRSSQDDYGGSHYSPIPRNSGTLRHESHRDVLVSPKMRGGDKLADGRLSPWYDFSPVRRRSPEDSRSTQAQNEGFVEPGDDKVKVSHPHREPCRHTEAEIAQAYREADAFLASLAPLVKELGLGFGFPEKDATEQAAIATTPRLRSEDADPTEQAAQQRQCKKLKVEHHAEFGGALESSSMEGIETQSSALKEGTTACTTPESSPMELIHVGLGTPLPSFNVDGSNPEVSLGAPKGGEIGTEIQLAKPDCETALIYSGALPSRAQCDLVDQNSTVFPYNVTGFGNMMKVTQDERVVASVLNLDTIHPGLITTPTKSRLAYLDAVLGGNPDEIALYVSLSPDSPEPIEEVIPGVTKKLLVKDPPYDPLVISLMRDRDNVWVHRPTRTTALKMWGDQEEDAE